jgi:hypothetical protein
VVVARDEAACQNGNAPAGKHFEALFGSTVFEYHGFFYYSFRMS